MCINIAMSAIKHLTVVAINLVMTLIVH